MKYENYSALLNSTCDDQISWAAIISRHVISKEEFETRVNKQFGGNPEQRIRIDAQTLIAIGTDCKSKSWQYNRSATSNSQMNLKLDTIRADHQFSIQLFRGLNALLHAELFEFTLGKDNAGNTSVSFVALNQINEPVYFGNVSNYHP